MKKLLLITLAIVLVQACSKGTTKPQYNFKQAPKAGIVAKLGDVEITDAELIEGIDAEIYQKEKELFDLKFNKLKSIFMQKVMEKDSRKKDLSNDEYLEKYIAPNIKISETDINKFIKDQQIPAEHINPQVKEKIKAYMTMEKKKLAVDEWLAKELGKTNIEVYIQQPRRPTYPVVVGNAPFVGGEKAKVEVVEFSDFQCPYCAKGAEVINKLKAKYKDKVKVAFKNFPLPFHNQAEQAAVAGLCANEQGKDNFGKMHDAMFADQAKLDSNSLKATAKKIGLKTETFDACLDSNKYLANVKADMEEAKKYNVKSTPTFFVNGQLINGAQAIEVFEEIIDEELAK